MIIYKNWTYIQELHVEATTKNGPGVIRRVVLSRTNLNRIDQGSNIAGFLYESRWWIRKAPRHNYYMYVYVYRFNYKHTHTRARMIGCIKGMILARVRVSQKRMRIAIQRMGRKGATRGVFIGPLIGRPQQTRFLLLLLCYPFSFSFFLLLFSSLRHFPS